jgi:plastocyanin
MRRFVHGFALATVLALALVACASNKDTGLPAGPTTPGTPAGGGLTVAMPDSLLKFVPGTITVKVGDTVTWTNDGAVPHTVTAVDGTFDSGTADKPIEAGKDFKFTFTKAGKYPYYCRLHAPPGGGSGMIGEIDVGAGSGSPSPTSS